MLDWIKKRLRQCRIGLTPLFLLLFVTACATTEPRIETRVALPPQELLQPCASVAAIAARHALETNAGILPYVRDLKAALRACGADKDAIIEWAAALRPQQDRASALPKE